MRSTLKLKLSIHILLIIGYFRVVQGQEPLRIGEWEAHLSYQIAEWVTQSEDDLYISSGASIVKIDKESVVNGDFMEPEFITKIDGLSETIIDRIAYDKGNDQLFVIYASSNIDVIRGGEILNIPFIKNNTNIVGSRSINDIHFSDEDNAYIAGAFGLINVNLKTLDFRYTTFTNSAVLSVVDNGEKVYMGLDEGMYSISLSDINPIDFSRWQFIGSNQGLPTIYSAEHLEYANDQLFFTVDGQLWKEENGDFRQTDLIIPSGFTIQFLSAEQEDLIVGMKNAQRRAEVVKIDGEGGITFSDANCPNDLYYGIELEDGSMWYADGFRGMRYSTSFNANCQRITFSGPRSNLCSEIKVDNDKVYFASGGASDNYALLSVREGIYILDNNVWNNINETEYPILKDSQFLNFVGVTPHRTENKVWMSSYFSGLALYDLDNMSFELLNGGNSPLKGVTPGDIRARVAQTLYDRQGNLWIANFASPEPIVVFTKEGTRHSFEVPISNTNLAEIAIDGAGNIYFTVIGNNGGVLVYDPGESIPDPTDDNYRYFSGSELPSSIIYSIAADLDGDVWVGTNQGPAAIECDPFNENCLPSQRKVEEDEIGAVLLATEEIFSIGFDGANRKWFGTRNGLFVQSPDAVDQIELYTEENSPLFSNVVNALGFDPKSGRMYIATNSGIQSVKTPTLGANRRHDSEVYAYPNPVRPDYQGPIAIKGLGRDANVKITDLSGNLVFETQALGGQAIWDGRDYTGRKAIGGVYLVFSSSRVSFDTSDEFVTKIMLID